jgi:hypothetical protein
MNMIKLVILGLALCAWTGCRTEPAGQGRPAPAAVDMDRASEAGQGNANVASDALPGRLELVNVPVSTALDIYRGLTGKELIIPAEIEQSPARVSLSTKERPTRERAMKLLESSLREKGVILRPLDASRVAVEMPLTAAAAPAR